MLLSHSPVDKRWQPPSSLLLLALLWGGSCRSQGCKAAGCECERACACAHVCMCVSVRARGLPAAGPPTAPHPPPPARRPRPSLAGCAPGRCAPPALGGDPRRAPGSKAPRGGPSPSGGRGGEGVVRAPEKPEPTAGPAQGWAARSQVCDRRRQLLAGARDAASKRAPASDPAAGGRGRCAGPSALSRPQESVLPARCPGA